MRSRYLAAAILALTLPIAVFHSITGPLVLAFLEVTADAISFLVPVALAAGGLAIVGVIAQPRAVSYAGHHATKGRRSAGAPRVQGFRFDGRPDRDYGRARPRADGERCVFRITGLSADEMLGRLQGYHYSRPLTPTALARFFAEFAVISASESAVPEAMPVNV